MHRFLFVEPRQLGMGALYDLIAAAVMPRPIACVSTLSPEGIPNLAPYSFFMAGGVNPPSLVFCPSATRSGEDKDSLRNAESTGEFVVSALTRAMVEGMNRASLELGPGESEWPASGLTMAPCALVRPARVAESPVSFECRVFEIVRHGRGPHATNYVIGEVVALHLAESVWDGERLHLGELRLVGRLGGQEYLDTAIPEIFALARPSGAPSTSVEQ